MHLGEATFETCSGDRRSRLAMPVPKDRLIPDWVEGAGRFPTEGRRRRAVPTVQVAVIPGDGIGPEVVSEAVRVLDRAAGLAPDLHFFYRWFDWGSDYFRSHGVMMPEDGLDILSGCDAIFLGAVGAPTVPDHVSLWGLLLPIRRGFDQYVNLRPTRLWPGVEGPLRRFGVGDIDFVVVRENSEGEYSNMGGRLRPHTPQEVVVQNAVFTRFGVERIIRYAFDLARTRRGHVTGATKSNGINFSMPFWDEVFNEVGEEYPDVKRDLVHVDALAARFITAPDRLDVVVGSNLFGDILTDIAAAIAGSIGMGAAANLNPERTSPSMFEPVHGSAPDIVGRGIANPVGQILTARMLLDHLGYPAVGRAIEAAVESTLADGIKTPDIGGQARTTEVTDAVIARLQA